MNTKPLYKKPVSNNKELNTTMPTPNTVETELKQEVLVEKITDTQSDVTTVIEPVVTQAPTVTNVKTTVKAEPTSGLNVPALLDTIRESGTVFEKMTLTGLDIYKKNMAPKVPVEPSDGAKYQNNLWKVIQSVLENAPENEFTKIWSIVLIYIHVEREGVFNDKYLYRFAEHWGWGLDELNTFQRVLHLATLTADSTTRKENLKKVSMSKITASGFSERAKQRISNYYLN
jgi:hypothetical protein